MSIDNLGYTKTLEDIASLEEAQEKVQAALKENGFGVISEIDLQATMKEKLGKDVKPYKILGACNPKMAHKALSMDQYLGLMLPCNVIVFENDDQTFTVSFAKPKEMFKLVDKSEMAAVSEEVDAMIRAAFELL